MGTNSVARLWSRDALLLLFWTLSSQKRRLPRKSSKPQWVRFSVLLRIISCSDSSLEESGEAELGTLDTIGIGCDVASEQSVAAAVQEVVDRWGRIDTVVASAGPSLPAMEHFGCFTYSSQYFFLFCNRYCGELFCTGVSPSHIKVFARSGINLNFSLKQLPSGPD